MLEGVSSADLLGELGRVAAYSNAKAKLGNDEFIEEVLLTLDVEE
jgi:hypothetical protein